MRRVVLRTYNKLWKMPFKIYSIDNLKLIVPINPWDVLVFGICVILIALISQIIFFIHIPFVVKYFILPWFITKILDAVKLDGKKPYKYIFDRLRFAIRSKQFAKFKVLKNDKLIGFKEKIVLRKQKREVLINQDQLHKKTLEKLSCDLNGK